MNQDFLSAPPEGAIPTAQEKAPGIKYKNTKGIGKDFADSVTPEWIKQKFAVGEYGFTMYDREEDKNIPMPEFSFVVLEVYAGVSGYNPDKKERFWSNRAKDTRVELLRVYSNLSQYPVVGLYAQIKGELPKGAKYKKFVKAYCLQTKSVVEITLSAMVESAIQKAVAATETSEKKQSAWEKVFLLALADNDHLWGFHLTGHTTTNINGDPYSSKDDYLFFSPVFKAGIVDPTKNKILHDLCSTAQEQERALHAKYQERYRTEAPPPDAAPAEQENGRMASAAETLRAEEMPDTGFPAEAPPANGDDDLPF